MLSINFVAVLVAALVPIITGFIWYHPKTLGMAWMKAAGLEEEKMKEGFNAPVVFGLSFVFSFLIAISVNFMVIHQFGVQSAMMDMSHPDAIKDATQGIGLDFANFMSKYGNNFRTFKHGVLHGTLVGLMFVLPVFATNAMFERKSAKYVAINVGYWIISLALMGGIICAWQ
jgi:hypothetical protein